MSGMSASLSGVQTAALSVGVVAQNVANANTADYKAARLEQESLVQGGVRATGLRESQEAAASGRSNVDLAQEAVALKADKVTYEANLQVLQVQSQILGSVMDMKA